MGNKLKSINELFKEEDKGNIGFWRNLGVSIDKINDYSSFLLGKKYKDILKKSSRDLLLEFESILGFEENELNNDGKIDQLCEVPEEIKREIVILKDFLSRKKKSVISYYNYVSVGFDTPFTHSQIIQLKQLLDDSIQHLICIYTLHNWLIRGTGDVFSSNKSINLDKALSIPEKGAEHFEGELYKKSSESNKYRVFSFTSYDNINVLIILYRQINDTSVPDFDEPFRNKEIAPIMININTEENTLEVRSKFKKEVRWIKEYFEEVLDNSFTEIKREIFKEYDSDIVLKAFLEGKTSDKEEIQDLVVNKISFRNSPLINSPKLSFSLENGDIFTSVKDAHNKECLYLESIKDVESLSFTFRSIKRTVKSTVFDEGNILFSMNDRGISSELKEQLEDSFFNRFGIPLNKLISNAKFRAGKADLTDYIMTLSIVEELSSEEEEVLKKLKKEGIINEYTTENIYCENTECDFHSKKEKEFIDECPECGYNQLGLETFCVLEISLRDIRKYIKSLVRVFCDLSDWEIRSEPKKTFFSKEYEFINLINKESGEAFQILIHQGAIQNNFLEKLNRSLTPTAIIFVGVPEKHLSKYNNGCIFPVNFGKIYNMVKPEEVFKKVYESIEHRAKSFLSSSANKSFEILKNLPDPQNLGEDYSPSDFEDDVFNLLKDIFPNADKWGSNMSGKEVPEGMFTLTYKIKGPIDNTKKYVYSYDCKLNKNNQGYDLKKGEQRKAVDYVTMLNHVRHITHYSTSQQLSSHIFISNNFNENNFETMAEHFYKMLPEGYNARPIFLPLNVLVYLHSQYTKNHQKINNSRNIFMESLQNVLTTDRYVITQSDIDDVIGDSVDESLAEYHDIDTEKVRKEVLKKTKKEGMKSGISH
ncbi:hypothetical protein [Oceanobacillus oncorhynchi]|uniref:hypothetical protein n=1 Tax=Oceanobacillus oncorhynchi TaxID=545501 RepID=UPI0021168A7D|nr:hypothetical protein [Oceanobacillus oncorhynchi]UUI41170.1 hypothetical protein NP440_06280 [Oceanobacillus oncorhynchi]